ncbi:MULTISPECIES: alpha/beta fold hydrolase [unclassified Streptosporangium]|uniref:alpha/beta fold hydrolase n=1 Tax=unclassified Streptosporangium TaxID=2632669 RepID=UPI002E291510|nr:MULTISPECIES: alpha/beta fold hydrolase [unclassified Streptosporangium]
MNIVASFVIGAVTAVAPVTTTPLSWQDCGDGLRCGRMEVPADWARPTGERISLDLALLPARDQAAKKGALVVNLGGPGPQIAMLRQGGKDALADLTRWFDVVIFDPRGFGKSSGVSCPTPASFEAEWVFPSKSAYNAYAAKNHRFGQACRKAAGPLAGNLNSWQMARDLDAIRTALGQNKLNYYGNSHGTVIGQAYAEFFPGNVGRMFLDSVVDHTNRSIGDWLKPRANTLERSLHRFAEWCAKTSTCSLYGQNAVAVWDEVISKARRQPIPAPAGGTGSKVSAALIVARASFTQERSWPRLATALAQARAGDASLFLQTPGAPDPDLSRIMLCADFPYPSSYRDLKALEKDLRRASPHVGWRAVWPMANHCAGLPSVKAFAPHPFRAPGLPPVLITSGEYDDNTPPQDSRRLTALLPGARYLPAVGGHALYLGGHPCVRKHAHRYLTTGTIPPAGAACGPAAS